MTPMEVPLIKVEYFGGPADGDKRSASESVEFWTVDGRTVHRYVAAPRGMEWKGEAPGELLEILADCTIHKLPVGMDR